MVCNTLTPESLARRRQAGFSLVEALIAVGVAGILILVLTNVSMLSGRMFAAFANYVDLDDDNRIAMDTMTRDLRECNGVISYSSTELVVQDSDGVNITYTYLPDRTELRRRKGTENPRVLLTGCDSFKFNLGTRNPLGGSFEVNPTTDVSHAKVVYLTWNCSRSILGNKANTENVQTARIVIRKQGT